MSIPENILHVLENSGAFSEKLKVEHLEYRYLFFKHFDTVDSFNSLLNIYSKSVVYSYESPFVDTSFIKILKDINL